MGFLKTFLQPIIHKHVIVVISPILWRLKIYDDNEKAVFGISGCQFVVVYVLIVYIIFVSNGIKMQLSNAVLID